MTEFQFGLLIGCFLGGLVMFVIMGIFQLYLQEKEEKHARVGEETARGIQTSIGQLAYTTQAPTDHLPCLALEETDAEGDVTVCHFFIIVG